MFNLTIHQIMARPLHVLLVLILLWRLAATGAVAQTGVQVVEHTLPNGLKVYLSENHAKPQVYGMVVVNAGGKNDPAEATGIAHYLEHMLFKGTQTFGTVDYEKEKIHLENIYALYDKLAQTTDPAQRKDIQQQINAESKLAGQYAVPNELDRMLAEAGGTGINAYTAPDYTAYHNVFPASQMDRWLQLYADRFVDPVFRLFQAELEIVYEEKNRAADDAFTAAFEAMAAQFFKKHPYGQQTILGSVEHLKNPSLRKMYEFYNNYYVANNMALVLVGDFNAQEVLPKVEAYFGKWRTGTVPPTPHYDEPAFNGTEITKLRMTPIRVGALAFRMPKAGHPDIPALMLASKLLTNSQGSGLIDQLTTDRKLLFSQYFDLYLEDYGASIVAFAPKLIGQSFNKAKGLVVKQMEKLRTGDFDDNLLASVRLNLQNELTESLEDNNARAELIIQAFMEGKSWPDYLAQRQSVGKLTKEDVMRVAGLYYGPNLLFIQSRMGFPKKIKLDKPGFDPIIPQPGLQSAYYQQFQKSADVTLKQEPIAFDKAFDTRALAPLCTLRTAKNPENDIFSLTIKFKAGQHTLPVLHALGDYLSQAGAGTYDSKSYKKAWFDIGCNFGVEVTDDETLIRVSGNDAQFQQALQLLAPLLSSPEKSAATFKQVIQQYKQNRKLELAEAQSVGGALISYALYGENSKVLAQLGPKTLNSMGLDQLLQAHQQVQSYETDVHYVGRLGTDQVATLVANELKLKPTQPKAPVFDRTVRAVQEPTVYFCQMKNAVQTQVYFALPVGPMKLEQLPVANAFNSYFDGDMASLVFQEIREFRSLAYSAWGELYPGRLQGLPGRFVGYVGCQADKLYDAIDAMKGLIENMPVKADRLTAVRNSLLLSLQTGRPGFREVISRVLRWQEMGYATDPTAQFEQAYKAIDFDKIVAYYKQELVGKPLIIAVVGDEKRFDASKLTEYGKVIRIKQDVLFKP